MKLTFPATIRKNNRVTIPKEVMKAKKLKEGDIVIVTINERSSV